MKKFDKDEGKPPKFIVCDILGISIKVGDYVACATGSYRGSKTLVLGTVVKLNGKTVKVKDQNTKTYYSEFNIAGERTVIINEKKNEAI
jgi:hypothetical protein